ncbi:MAG: 50S ribosomal protein L4 [Chloroflexi bacterium]|nr:50S ribosomal protein L4 [Chloroflexota bacterium]
MLAIIRNQEGKSVGQLELDDEVFGVTPNEAVIHQALVRQRANARQGTVSTKTRGEVAGSTAKLFRQKGTGRARQGSVRAPHRVGGGIVFGPRPRSYRQAMPKKMRRLAIRSMLSSKLEEGLLIILDSLDFQEPKTKRVAGILEALGVDGSALIATPQPDNNVYRSARGLERVKTLPAYQLNVGDLLSSTYLVMPVEAVKVVEEIFHPRRERAEQQAAAG